MAYNHGVQFRLIPPGKPNQNAYIESFNGRQCDECLNEYWFTHCWMRAPRSRHGAGTTTNSGRKRHGAD